MKKEEYILKLFPEIEEIKDNEIKKGVIKAWLVTLDKTIYKKLEEVPQNIKVMPKGRSLVEHVRVVTVSAIEIAKIYKKTSGIKVNLDYLIAACLLHDLDKLLGYEIKEGKKERKAFYPHGVESAFITLEAGLPREIAHLVCVHTPSAIMKPQSPVKVEGLILQYVDVLHADVLRALYPAEPIMKLMVSHVPSSVFHQS